MKTLDVLIKQAEYCQAHLNPMLREEAKNIAYIQTADRRSSPIIQSSQIRGNNIQPKSDQQQSENPLEAMIENEIMDSSHTVE